MKKSISTILALLFITAQLFAQKNNPLMLNLLSPTYPLTFNMIGNGYWEETYNELDYTFFKSQIFSLSHLIEGEGSSYSGWVWNGFTVCNSGDSTNHNHQTWSPLYEWGCMAGGGIMTDVQGNVILDEDGDVKTEQGIPYLTGFWNNLMEPEYFYLGVHFLDEPTRCLQMIVDEGEEYEAVGVYVCNHPYAYYAAKYGYASSRKLDQPGDYFKLIIHGINPDGTESGKSVEHFLAKYENGQLFQSRKWEWVDLSSLGEIGGIYCTMQSTDADNWGPKTPVYFCMDKLQVKIKGAEDPHISVSNIVNLPDSVKVGTPLTLTGTVIPHNATFKTISWSIVLAGSTGTTITDNLLYTTNVGAAVLKATIENGVAMGENYTQDFTIMVYDIIGIQENEMINIHIYSYLNKIFIKNETDILLKHIEITDMQGRVVHTTNGTIQEITLVVPDGIYFVKMISETGLMKVSKISITKL